MKNSKALLKNAGILPKLRLGFKLPKGGVKSTGAHRVKVIEDKVIKKPDHSGNEIEWVRYIVEENGEQKYYDTKLKDKTGQLSYLVQRFAEIEEGEELILEMRREGAKNFIEVTPASQRDSIELEDEHDEEEEETIEL